jgi:hypothetical protein
LISTHPYGCRCAACTARLVLAPLDTGRLADARSLLADLSDLTMEECGRAFAQGHDRAVLALRRAGGKARLKA